MNLFRLATLVLVAGALWLADNGFGSSVANTPAAETLTQGWAPLPFTFEIQHPYDLKASDRYSYDPKTDIHDFWVYFKDKPHAPPPNQTTARTEMRLETYNRGEYMFDADYYVCPGTFACIAQVFDAAHGPVTMFIAHPDGTVVAGHTVIATNVIDRWWNLKIANDLAPGGKIKVYADDVLVGTFDNRGPRDYYFKCGVYSRKNSNRSEVRVRDIKMWVKPSTSPTASVKLPDHE
jgi:hypothetical protein